MWHARFEASCKLKQADERLFFGHVVLLWNAARHHNRGALYIQGSIGFSAAGIINRSPVRHRSGSLP